MTGGEFERDENINFWHLHALRTLFAASTMSAASLELGLTQPSVSQAIRSLERRYGADLVLRSNGLFRATQEGRILADRAGRTLDILCEGLSETTGLSPRQALQLVRAVSSSRLQALMTLVKVGGFAAAARAIGRSAPTLHRAARDLETALGAVLFETTSFGVRPTRLAEGLARYASLAFAEMRQARAEIDAANNKDSGRTVIGAMPFARSHMAPIAVEEFSRDYSGHRVSIVEGVYEDLVARLRHGEVDFLVGALREGLDAKDLKQTHLFFDHLSIVMRSGHPARKINRLSRRVLLDYGWIAPRAGSPLRRHFDDLFAGGPAPASIIECNSVSASRVILTNSDRLMLLSDAQIEFEKAASVLATRPHPHGPIARSIGLTVRSNWRPTEIQAALMKHMSRVGAAERSSP